MFNLYCYRYQNLELHTDTLYNMFIAFFFTVLCIPADKLHGCELLLILFQIIAFYRHYFKISSNLVLINMNFTYQKS